MQCAAHDDGVAVTADGQSQRLVRVCGAAGRKAADVGTPQPGGQVLGVGKNSRGQLHRVQSPVQRHISGYDIAHEILPLLVSRDCEWRGCHLLESQPRVEQGGAAAQSARVSGHGASIGKRLDACVWLEVVSSVSKPTRGFAHR